LFNAEFVPSGVGDFPETRLLPVYKALKCFSSTGFKASADQKFPVYMLDSQNVANSTNLNIHVQMTKLHAVWGCPTYNVRHLINPSRKELKI
jgi:hypothetical protein